MKAIKLLMSIILVATLAVAFESCKGGGDDPDPGPKEETEAERVSKILMSGTWKLNTVTIDGVSKSMFTNLAITFNVNGFSAANGEPVWPTAGTWSFSDQTAKVITRGDQTTVNIESIDESSMTLSLTWTKSTLGPGRVESIPGKHVFVFGK